MPGQVLAQRADHVVVFHWWHGLGGHVSAEGLIALAEAERASRPNEKVRKEIRAARERLLRAVAADELNIARIRNAMERERSLVMNERVRRDRLWLIAYRQLSLSDRRAFAAISRPR
jgi:uncharacterized membrane protein